MYIIIHEMFNVMDRRDRNFGVDFLLLFSHFDLKSFDSPNIFNYSYMYMYILYILSRINTCIRVHVPYQTPRISNQALVFMRVVKNIMSQTDILVKSAILKMVPSQNLCTLKLSEQPNFYNLG